MVSGEQRKVICGLKKSYGYNTGKKECWYSNAFTLGTG